VVKPRVPKLAKTKVVTQAYEFIYDKLSLKEQTGLTHKLRGNLLVVGFCVSKLAEQERKRGCIEE